MCNIKIPSTLTDARQKLAWLSGYEQALEDMSTPATESVAESDTQNVQTNNVDNLRNRGMDDSSINHQSVGIDYYPVRVSRSRAGCTCNQYPRELQSNPPNWALILNTYYFTDCPEHGETIRKLIEICTTSN